MTLLGVARLALPSLMVEIEATAADQPKAIDIAATQIPGWTAAARPSAEAVLKLADQRLYSAKQAGRNRVVSSDRP